MSDRNAIRQYQKVDTQSGIMDASPHQLIALLINGALSRLSYAKGCIERNDFAGKGEQLGKGIDIINALQGCLDMDAGGEVSVNLNALYDYMLRRLMQASLNNDTAIIDEVTSLLREIKSGWDGIPQRLQAAQADGQTVAV